MFRFGHRLPAMPSRLIAAVALAALALVACGGSGDDALASVAGHDISRDEVLALRTTPEDAVVLDSEDFRNELMFVIAQETLAASAETEFAVVVTEDDIDRALETQLESTGISMEEAVAALEEPAATEERLRRVVRSQLLRDATTRPRSSFACR